MSTVTAYNHKTFGAGFHNELQMVELVYDFAHDAGAYADVVKIGTTNAKILVMAAQVQVVTTCTSGGSATVIIGPAGGDTDAFLDLTSGAVANLTADAVLSETTGQGIVIASDTAIHFDIGTADLTAGKVKLVLLYKLA